MEFKKKKLLDALKEAGLPCTPPNFLYRYEKMKCKEHKKPFLISKRGKNNERLYTQQDIDSIIKIAKEGWFVKHWHWPPLKKDEIQVQ